MSRLAILLALAPEVVLVLFGCGGVATHVREGDLGEACHAARSGTAAERDTVASAIDAQSLLSWQVLPVSAAQLEARVGVPAELTDLIPLRIVARVEAEATDTRDFHLWPLTLWLDGTATTLGWPAKSDRQNPPELLALFPSPTVEERLPHPEPFRSQHYEEIPRPRVTRRGGGRGGNAVESAVTGFLSALSLGRVRHTGQGSAGTLTPESRRALRRWHAENEAGRAAFEEAERERRDAHREDIRRVNEHNAHREDEHRAWRREAKLHELRAWRTPSCDFRAEESARMYSTAGTECEWIVFVPRPAAGSVRIAVDQSVRITHFANCDRRASYQVEAAGELTDALEALFANPVATTSMHQIEASLAVD